MAIQLNKQTEEYLKRKRNDRYGNYGQQQVQPNGNQQGPGGPNGVSDFSTKYGANNVFDAARNNPTVTTTTQYRQGMDGGASSGGKPPIGDEVKPANTLADAIMMDNINNPTIASGGPNAIQGAKPVTPGSIQQPNGTERNETPDNAAGQQAKGGQKPGFNAVLESLNYKPEGGEVNSPNKGTGMLGTPNGPEDSSAPKENGSGKIGGETNGSGNINNKNGSENVNGNENNKGNVNNSGNKANENDSANGKVEDETNPETEAQMNKKEIKQEEQRQQAIEEEKLRKILEEQLQKQEEEAA